VQDGTEEVRDVTRGGKRMPKWIQLVGRKKRTVSIRVDVS
jgi:hypothetical protein